MTNTKGITLDQEEQYERAKREDMERWERFHIIGHAISHATAAAWLTRLARGQHAPCPV